MMYLEMRVYNLSGQVKTIVAFTSNCVIYPGLIEAPLISSFVVLYIDVIVQLSN